MSIARESLAYDDEEENLRMMDLLMKEEATLPPSSYQPQLMDEHAMSDLKRHLAKSQARLASDGYLREFAPRKPSTSSVLRGTRPRLNGDSCRLISSAPMPMTASTSPEAHPETSQTKAKADVNMTPRSAIAASQARRKVEYNAALRREVHTIRELESHYESVKHGLLDQMEQLCTMKFNERDLVSSAYDMLKEMKQFLQSTDNQKT